MVCKDGLEVLVGGRAMWGSCGNVVPQNLDPDDMSTSATVPKLAEVVEACAVYRRSRRPKS